MSGSEPSVLEGRTGRRLLLTFVVLPPIASVVGAVIGVFDLQASIVAVITAILVLLAILLEITLQARMDQREEVRAYRHDEEAIPDLIRFVNENHPKTADLLEYSAIGAMGLLAKLGESGTTERVRLLVAHPGAAISEYQRNYRLAEGLRTLSYRVPVERARKIGLEVRCYKEAASIRGRLLGGKLLVVGWYSYDDRGLADPGQQQISGGTNASLGAYVGHAVGGALFDTYSRAFENIWKSAEEAGQAWEGYRDTLPQLPNSEWLAAVRSRGKEQ